MRRELAELRPRRGRPRIVEVDPEASSYTWVEPRRYRLRLSSKDRTRAKPCAVPWCRRTAIRTISRTIEDRVIFVEISS